MAEEEVGRGGTARVVLVTAPTKEVGLRIARELVEARVVACVNLIEGAVSVYRWEGGVEEAEECLLVVKTNAGRIDELHAFLERHHPYDTPEVIALQPASVERRYLDWLLGASAPSDPRAGGSERS